MCRWKSVEETIKDRKKMMKVFREDLAEYQKQLTKGSIQRAYKGIMEGISGMQRTLTSRYPEYISGGLYQGYMDMTYFPLTPPDLKEKGLKVAIVFIHEKGQLEIWLAARNKKIQREFIEKFESGQSVHYSISKAEKGVDSIIEHPVLLDPDFHQMDSLVDTVGHSIETFIHDVRNIIS